MLEAHHLIAGVIGAALMVFVIYASLAPYPAMPYGWLPPAFAAYMAVGLVWFLVLKAKAPQVLVNIAMDMEG